MPASGSRRPTARRSPSGAVKPSAAPPTPLISCSTRRSSPAGWAIPNSAGSTCSSYSPLCTRRALPCRPRAGWRRRWASTRRPATATPASCCAPPAPLSKRSMIRPGRRGMAPSASCKPCRASAGAGRPCSSSGCASPKRPNDRCSPACRNGRTRRPAPPRTASPCPMQRSTRGLMPCWATGPSGVKGNAPMHWRSAPPSSRGERRKAPTWCSPKPAPASARRWAISPRQAAGRRRRKAPSGCRPLPRPCNASSTRKPRVPIPTRPKNGPRSWCARAAKITSACSTSKTRCRAVLPIAPRYLRNWRRAGPNTAAMATWWAATCPAGYHGCSGGPAFRG